MIGAMWAYDPSRGLIRRRACRRRDMKWEIATALAAMALTKTCFAADPRHPDWPCAQAKVPGVPVG